MLLWFFYSVGCPMEQDTTWNILWPATSTNKEAIQQCLGNGQFRTCNIKHYNPLNQTYTSDGLWVCLLLDYGTCSIIH